MSNNNSDNSDKTEERVRIAVIVPLSLNEELETERLALQVPPSKTGFLTHILNIGLEAHKRDRSKSKK